MDEQITRRLDTIIMLLKQLLKQQGAEATEDDGTIKLGPFLGDGAVYRVHPGELPVPRDE